MKKILALVFAAVLLATPVMAGQIGSPGFTEQQGEAPAGSTWMILDGMWYLYIL